MIIQGQRTIKDSPWRKVAGKAGEKAASKMHSSMLKMAAGLSKDDYLNPELENQIWVGNFDQVMIEGAIRKLEKIKRLLYDDNQRWHDNQKEIARNEI